MIRSRHNKVPVMRFQFTRSSMLATATPTDTKSSHKSPFHVHSTLNPLFKLSTATPDARLRSVAGLKHLPMRVKDVAIALGIKSSFLFEKLRTKELTTQLTEAILENQNTAGAAAAATAATVPAIRIKQEFPAPASDAAGASQVPAMAAQLPTRTPLPARPALPARPPLQKCDSGTQTQPVDCNACVKRSKVVTATKSTQIFPKLCSIGVQTNEKDYREPIVEQLSRLTAAQLVAIKDFAIIIAEPRPQNAAELFKLKERMMDVYNLSQRDADAVRVAEENRLDDVNYIEQMRYRNSDANSSENSRDFDRMPQSPQFIEDRSFASFGANRFNGEPQRSFEEREHEREHEYHQRMLRERNRDEEEHERMLAIERDRERALEREQLLYEEQRRSDEVGQRRVYNRPQSQGGPPPQQQYRFDEDRGFNRNPSLPNRRGRGAFRAGRRR